MPSGLSEAPGGFGSDPGGFGGNQRPSWSGSDAAGNDMSNSPDDSYSGGPSDLGNWAGNYWSAPGPQGGGAMGPSFSLAPIRSFRDAFRDYEVGPSYKPENAFQPPSWDGKINLPEIKSPMKDLDNMGPGTDPDDGKGGGFWNSELGRMLRRTGMFALGMHPATRGAMALYNGINALTSGDTAGALGGLVGAVTKNPLLGTATNIGVNMYNGRPVGGQIGGTLGGMFGGMAAGPLGASIGGDIGRNIGAGFDKGQTGPAGPTPSQRTGTEGNSTVMAANNGTAPQIPKTEGQTQQAKPSTLEAIMAGGLSLYGLNRLRNTEKENAAAIRQQQAALENMFGGGQAFAGTGTASHRPAAPRGRSPNLGAISSRLDRMFGANSESARVLREQLSRADAAAGRRSQYGPREVELLARLTQMRAQAEPAYMNAEVAAANAANQHAYSVYAAQMQDANAQAALRQRQLESMFSGRTSATNALNQSRLLAEQRRQQQLNTLYNLGRDSGFFNYVGNMFN